VSSLVIFDTSIFIDHLRANRHRQRIEAVSGLIRTSSVVLAELWRGATRPAERAFLRVLQKHHPILTPTERQWLESGGLLGKIRSDRGLAPQQLRDLHFDVLIALTARAHGARLITSNGSDFELIRTYREFALEIW
jgi:predicted nucleic acid-binding protein